MNKVSFIILVFATSGVFAANYNCKFIDVKTWDVLHEVTIDTDLLQHVDYLYQESVVRFHCGSLKNFQTGETDLLCGFMKATTGTMYESPTAMTNTDF